MTRLFYNSRICFHTHHFLIFATNISYDTTTPGISAIFPGMLQKSFPDPWRQLPELMHIFEGAIYSSYPTTPQDTWEMGCVLSARMPDLVGGGGYEQRGGCSTLLPGLISASFRSFPFWKRPVWPSRPERCIQVGTPSMRLPTSFRLISAP